jgi:putative Mg2+ transporter-C (MgtC) family protein
MQPDITWTEVAVRLLLTLVAGAIIGTNRGEHRSPAGLRTTILVCLTASASMILGNLLIGTSGRAPNSFVTMDVMRLPLGILTGMGFIGAGAILHQGSMVLGVTTAATLWFTTLMGFCFGAGEHGLGMSLLGLGVFVLWCLEWVEVRWKRPRQATLIVMISREGPSREEITHAAESNGHKLSASAVSYTEEGEEAHFDVYWRASQQDTELPNYIAELARRSGVKKLHWTPAAKA